MSQRPKSGFTLVEIMIVVAIIGLLAVIAVPSFLNARIRGQGVATCNDMRVFGHAFVLYAMEKGQYPLDSHTSLPPGGIEDYLDADKWHAETPMGGHYNWEGPSSYPYAGVAVYSSSISDSELLKVDRLVDDGVLATGDYRKTPNGRWTYILEEQ